MKTMSRCLIGAVTCLAGCSAETFTSSQDDAAGTDAGPDGLPVGTPPMGCDATKLPTQDGCVVNESLGVFVSSSLGSAMGDGSRVHPLASLQAAIAVANKSHRRVYACAETYVESITLAEGTDVFGYFACGSGWALSTVHAVVKPMMASPAMTAMNIVAPTRLEAVDVTSPDFAAGQSSVALLAVSAPGLLVTHATLHAGAGGQGASGTPGAQLTDSGSLKNGANTHSMGVSSGYLAAIAYNAPPTAGSNTCVGGSGTYTPGPGGTGGKGGYLTSELYYTSWIWNPSWLASAGNPSTATTATAQGGAVGLGGTNGAAGANGTDGASAMTVGTLSASGYVTADGTAGTDGAPGQGGGGSGGVTLSSTSYPPQDYQNEYGYGEPGGSGGAGGCPGLAGTPGKGGGASIAVLAIQSGFALDTVVIQSSAGGAGGASGLGSLATAGGSGGTGYVTWGAGSGGAGGVAGISGNGAGGPSFAIAYQGTQPVQLASTTMVGAGGAGVAERVGGDGKTVPASANGLSLAVYAF